VGTGVFLYVAGQVAHPVTVEIKLNPNWKSVASGLDPVSAANPNTLTLPRGSDPFGNPQIDPVPREQVPQFYADFFTKPSRFNHGQTITGYLMEQSRGKAGITEVKAFGPYRMPKPLWAYGLNEYGQNDSTPDGSRASVRMEPDCDALWMADVGKDVRKEFDAVLRMYATYDETGVWQEFGEMKFNSKEDIPAEWGNPNPEKPRWIPTRYVPWTSWLWQALSSGGCPPCGRERIRGRSRMRSGIWFSAFPTSTTILM
jgi:hypothetical protein